jgi:hypothetical protein
MRLEIRSQYAGRRLGGTHPDGSPIHHANSGTPPSKLIRDATPDDPGADDDNIRGLAHGIHRFTTLSADRREGQKAKS